MAYSEKMMNRKNRLKARGREDRARYRDRENEVRRQVTVTSGV